jgi:hypothetical protein
MSDHTLPAWIWVLELSFLYGSNLKYAATRGDSSAQSSLFCR